MLNNRISDLLSEYKPDTRKIWAVLLTHIDGNDVRKIQQHVGVRWRRKRRLEMRQMCGRTHTRNVISASLRRD